MKRTAHAKWAGDLKGGSGAISTASGTLSQTPYSFHTRFEEGKGTNPEELLAAAHAGCFTMALSLQLSLAGLKARVPGASPEAFQTAAQAAKSGCPVSQLFNTTITLNAQLEG